MFLKYFFYSILFSISILLFQNCGPQSAEQTSISESSPLGKVLKSANAKTSIGLLFQNSQNCLKESAEQIQSYIDQGHSYVPVCSGAKINLKKALKIKFNSQKLYTVGLPSGELRAEFVADFDGPLLVSEFRGTELRSLIFRRKLSPSRSLPIVELKKFTMGTLENIDAFENNVIGTINLGGDPSECANALAMDVKAEIVLNCTDSLVAQSSEDENQVTEEEKLAEEERIKQAQERRLALLRYSMRAKFGLMATGIIPEKSRERLQALGLAEEYDRVKAQWQRKVKAMPKSEREVAGVAVLPSNATSPSKEAAAPSNNESKEAKVQSEEPQNIAKNGTQVGWREKMKNKAQESQEQQTVSNVEVVNNSQNDLEEQIENEAINQVSQKEETAEESEETAEEPEAEETLSFREQILRYVMRRKFGLMATGIIPEKSRSELENLGLAEEYDRVRGQWQNKVKSLSPDERKAAGVQVLE